MGRRVLVLAGVVAWLSCSAARGDVLSVVNQISVSSFTNYLVNSLPTHAGDSRAFNTGAVGGVIQHGADHDAAAETMFTGFRRSGWTTRYDPFTYNDDSGNAWNGRNVLAVKQGATRPDDIYIIGSHYDSVASRDTSPTSAPGADDNGSGLAGLLEMARVLSPYTFDATIVLAAFDGEEVTATVGGTGIHRLGSMWYASQHSTDNVLGMVSMDMIAWQDSANPNTARLETGYSQNAGINAAMTTALQTYGGLTVSTRNSLNYSDHVSFANRGIPALMLIEYNWASNPNYHRQADSVDTPGYIDYAYGTKMVKSVAGYVCTAALDDPLALGAVPEPPGVLVFVAGAVLSCAGWMRRRMR